MAEVLLAAQGLTKRFGGLAAVNEVSLTLRRNQIHAVIGPNGAGKSTLTNLLSGDLAPSAGTVLLRGQDISRWPAHRISRLGLGRSYQKTNIFLPFTVLENVRLAAQSRSGRKPWDPRSWLADTRRQASGSSDAQARCMRAIELAGLKNRVHSVAHAISHGEQRQLEIAIVLATEPAVLLLDEPLAGMGTAEAERMVSLLLRLKPDHAMLLVEHDMDAVFALADHMTVLVNGQLIATGSPAAIRADARVQAAYLGEEEAAHG